MSTTNTIDNLRHLLEEKRAEIQRLERERRKLSKKLDEISVSIEKLSGPAARSNQHESLAEAAGLGDAGLVARLLAAGADPNERNPDGESPLLLAAYRQSPLRLIRALIAGGADVNLPDNDGNTPLIVSVRDGQLSTVRELIQHGANVNARNEEGDTPLTNAACWGSVAVVKHLLRSGANPELADGKGVPAIVLARAQGHSKIVALLSRARR